jgi:DNA repair protein RecO (recombination protein O)
MSEAVAPARARPAAPRRGSDLRVEQQPAFVLHGYPWRETSLIVELLTRDAGRIAVVARGAKRATSQFRGLLAPFCPLSVSWSGRGDIRTLTRVEWGGALLPLRGEGLLAAFYLNELLVRLLARADPHENLYRCYAQALHGMAAGQQPHDAVLRQFELDLLRELGWLPSLEHCADGAPIDAAAAYRFDPVRGLERVQGVADPLCLQGTTVQAMRARAFTTPQAAAESKGVLRQMIRYHLNGKPLNTRRIFEDLKTL